MVSSHPVFGSIDGIAVSDVIWECALMDYVFYVVTQSAYSVIPTPVFLDSHKDSTQADGAQRHQSARATFLRIPMEPLGSLDLMDDSESEPFEESIDTETLSFGPLRRVRHLDATKTSLWKRMRVRPELVEDSDEDDDEEDEKIEESLDSDNVGEDAKDEGFTSEDEDPAARDEGLTTGVEGPGIDDKSYGLNDESHGMDDEGHR
ncbi:hypothetical protein Tco_1314494 [Tanacetum coccineum]